MSPEPRSVREVRPKESPKENPKENLGSLSACLVDGDAEQRSRERRVKRRALAIAMFFESAVLAALIAVPLFGKAERISLTIVTPVVPYGHANNHPRGHARTHISGRLIPDSRFLFHPPTTIVNQHAVEEATPGDPLAGDGPTGKQSNEGPNCSWCVDLGGRTSGPPPPQPSREAPTSPRMLKTQIDPAMLIRRVEPVYPPLAIHIHKEGRVELRAIIGTDGAIRSLQIVSGDPLFYISAREAVEQWRYKPTILNGQPVEIDTYITVIYTTEH